MTGAANLDGQSLQHPNISASQHLNISAAWYIGMLAMESCASRADDSLYDGESTRHGEDLCNYYEMLLEKYRLDMGYIEKLMLGKITALAPVALVTGSINAMVTFPLIHQCYGDFPSHPSVLWWLSLSSINFIIHNPLTSHNLITD